MSNVGDIVDGLSEDRETLLARVDALPASLRQIIKYAPFDYAVGPWWRDYNLRRAGYSEREIATDWARRMQRDRRREAGRLYGPSHPQAV